MERIRWAVRSTPVWVYPSPEFSTSFSNQEKNVRLWKPKIVNTRQEQQRYSSPIEFTTTPFDIEFAKQTSWAKWIFAQPWCKVADDFDLYWNVEDHWFDNLDPRLSTWDDDCMAADQRINKGNVDIGLTTSVEAFSSTHEKYDQLCREWTWLVRASRTIISSKMG